MIWVKRFEENDCTSHVIILQSWIDAGAFDRTRMTNMKMIKQIYKFFVS